MSEVFVRYLHAEGDLHQDVNGLAGGSMFVGGRQIGCLITDQSHFGDLTRHRVEWAQV